MKSGSHHGGTEARRIAKAPITGDQLTDALNSVAPEEAGEELAQLIIDRYIAFDLEPPDSDELFEELMNDAVLRVAARRILGGTN